MQAVNEMARKIITRISIAVQNVTSSISAHWRCN